MTQPTTVGMIGLGLMGHGIAKNLLAKGFALRFVVHRDRSRLADLLEAGAVECVTRAALAHGAQAILLCVTGTPQVESIVYGDDGLLANANEGTLVIDASTAEPASTARMRADFAARGVSFIDAPLARTPKEAEEGRLNTMVGASEADFERVRPILAAYCENVIHVGPPGHGHTLKLINNMLSMTTAAAIAEAVAAAAKAGLSLPKVFQLLSAGAVNSGILQLMLGRTLEGDLGGLKFAIANAQKDLRYYTHLTEMLATTSPLAEATHQTLVQATNLGLGERYVASLFEAQEQLNGVRIVPR
ncbi:MAG TPA: NAD(P)-dependent oxidoreductase, partial [Burkholderiaceae bacterium]|nr:NAD(P)-dependent oxidoreductase [Burkholderiaceae bacterium]